jgi:hypothetical protein
MVDVLLDSFRTPIMDLTIQGSLHDIPITVKVVSLLPGWLH